MQRSSSPSTSRSVQCAAVTTQRADIKDPKQTQMNEINEPKQIVLRGINSINEPRHIQMKVANEHKHIEQMREINENNKHK